MGQESSFLHRESFKNFVQVVGLLANIAIIVGIAFAFIQIKQANQTERKRVAIEAVRQTRSNEFTQAHTRLRTIYVSQHLNTENLNSIIDDLNYTMNVIDDIAILYINDIADKCIIKNMIYDSLKEFSPVLDFLSSSLSYPDEYRKNFEVLKELMEKEACN